MYFIVILYILIKHPNPYDSLLGGLFMAYIFTLASIIPIIGIAILFKLTLTKLVSNTEPVPKIISRFFITVAIIEIIPIILFVYGFANLETAASIEEVLVPAIILILVLVAGYLFVFLQKKFTIESTNEESESASQIQVLPLIVIGLMSALPISSFVAMMMMLP